MSIFERFEKHADRTFKDAGTRCLSCGRAIPSSKPRGRIVDGVFIAITIAPAQCNHSDASDVSGIDWDKYQAEQIQRIPERM